MADQPKKPRNVKDLKARLGRTISPSTKSGGGAPVPPPGVGGNPPGGVTPPPGGGAAPGGPGSPFAPPTQAPAQQPDARDPFAAASSPPPAQQEYRLVIDEKPVDDAEVGRRGRGRTFLIAGIFVVVGLLLGYGAGSIMKDRKIYNVAVRDGGDVYQAVRSAAETMNEAKRYLDSAVEAAKGGSGKSPSVDYEAIEKLRALENPFTANQFSRKSYNLFKASTVDSLFDYYNNSNLIFEKIENLASSTLPEPRREELDASASAAGNMATRQTGCVPDIVDNRYMCGMVYVQFPDREEGEAVSSAVEVSLNPGSPTSFEKQIYTGENFQDVEPKEYVILVNTQRSVGVLGQQASAFAEYNRKLLELNQLMNKTIETQGNLESELGKIAALTEIFAF